MHGEPSWSFLYRHMIPVLVDAGLRCRRPRPHRLRTSDKPTERADYTYARHAAWVRAFFDAAGLAMDITLVGQDWGGLIGLRLVGEEPDRFARVVAANTSLPTGDTRTPDAFLTGRSSPRKRRCFPIGAIVERRLHERPHT